MDIIIGYIKTGSIKVENPYSEEEWKALSPGARQEWAEAVIESQADSILLQGFNDYSPEDGGGFDEIPDIAFVYGVTESTEEGEGHIVENRTKVYEAYHSELPALGEEYIL